MEFSDLSHITAHREQDICIALGANNQLALSSHAPPGSLQGPTPEPTWSPSTALDWGTLKDALVGCEGEEPCWFFTDLAPKLLSWLSRGKQGVETEPLRKDPGQDSGRPLHLGSGRSRVAVSG